MQLKDVCPKFGSKGASKTSDIRCYTYNTTRVHRVGVQYYANTTKAVCLYVHQRYCACGAYPRKPNACSVVLSEHFDF